MVTKAVQGIEVLFPQLGLCANMMACMQKADVFQHHRTMVGTVAQCLASGFEYYSGDDAYSIAHPTLEPEQAYREAFQAGTLWEGEYGQRRYAAMQFIKDNAGSFYLEAPQELRFSDLF